LVLAPVGWPIFTLKDAIDVAGCLPKLVDEMGTVGDQATAGDEVAFNIDRWEFVPGRKGDDQLTMKCRQGARRYDQAAIGPFGERRHSTLNLAGINKLTGVNSTRNDDGLDGG